MVAQADWPGRRLVVLRELLELTQAELAAKGAVAQALISHIERGNRELTEDVRVKIAAGTQMPLTFFDVSVAQIDEDSVHYRKTAGASMKSRRGALARFGEAERIAHRLLADASHQLSELTQVTSLGLNPHDVEIIALEVRRQLGIADAAPVRHVMRAIERTGVAVVPLTGVSELADLLDGHSGMSRFDQLTGYPVIGYAPTNAGDRQRLTIAHELGHVVLHSRRDLPVKLREAEAMHFASAFMYPKDIALTDISESLSLNGYARIKAEWGISIQALVRRGRDLGLISMDRYRSLMVQLSGRGWRRSEPVDVDMERPALLWQFLSDQYGAKPYMRASHKLGMSPRFLEAWIPPRLASVNSHPASRTSGGDAQVIDLFAGAQNAGRTERVGGRLGK